MARSIWQQYIQDSNGRPRVGAVITVKDSATEEDAEIFTAQVGGSPVATVSSSSTGRAFFWIEPGVYDITATYGSGSATQTSVEIGPVLRGGTTEEATILISKVFSTSPVEVEIVAGEATIDWSQGTKFNLTLDQNLSVLNFANVDQSLAQEITVVIVNEGSFTITDFTPEAVGIDIKWAVGATRQPAPSSITAYGCWIQGTDLIFIVPKEFED